MTQPATCLHCHTPISDVGRFCPSCGLDSSDPEATERVVVDPAFALYSQLWRAVAGHYSFDKVLGRGGMGVVFLARDLLLDRPVAIKVLPPELAVDEKFVGRFQREARTAAKLDHPGIVPIHSVESAAGFHFFAMKYVAGRTVDHLLEAGPLPIETCLRILRDAASALGHAHARGVVHRDVKPGNIMVDPEGRALVMDFGISKALQSGAPLTQTGQVVGTPHYMSPEQAKGVDLDGRSDQYSLALVGYQMLTGQTPFQADSPHSVLLKHILEVLPPVRSARPDVPSHVSEALARALAKEPAERFATMEEFAGALADESRAARSGPRRPPAPARPRGRPQARSNRRRLIGLALVAVAAVAVPAWLLLVRGATPSDAGAGEVPQSAARAVQDSEPAAPARDSQAAPPPRDTEPASRPSEPAIRSAAPPRAAARQAPAAVAVVGWLTIDSDPFGMVQIDGVDVRDTPLIRHQLSPGSYTVRVAREGYQPWSASITITAGNTVSRRITLVPAQ